MKLPEPHTKTFSTLVDEIEKGQIKIPQFQRDFVWTMQKSAGLIDSIVKGYPIGTFIFWRTKERLRSVRDIGKQVLP
ncbi:GmrSD restriction endonuclease domain-containing protein [Nostoc sp.]